MSKQSGRLVLRETHSKANPLYSTINEEEPAYVIKKYGNFYINVYVIIILYAKNAAII